MFSRRAMSAPTDVPAAWDVLKTFFDNGGKVVDVLHGGHIGEQAARTAQEMGQLLPPADRHVDLSTHARAHASVQAPAA